MTTLVMTTVCSIGYLCVNMWLCRSVALNAKALCLCGLTCALTLVLAIVLKFWGYVLSGVIFFSQNAWAGWGAWGYSLAYHLSSKIPEGILTIAVVLFLPLSGMKKALLKQS